MEIKEIKERLGIDELVRHYGYKPTVKDLLICPFCGDVTKPRKKKTFQIYKDTNRFNCFHPKCVTEFGRGDGDVFDFIERQEKTTKSESIKIAKKILGVEALPPSNTKETAKTDKKIKRTTSSDTRPEREKQPERSEGQDLRSSASAVFFNAENPSEIIFRKKGLEIEVLGGINLFSLDKLHVSLKLTNTTSNNRSIRHKLDFYNDDYVEKLIRKVAERQELSTGFVREIINDLIDELEFYRKEENRKRNAKPKEIPLTPEEYQEVKLFLETTNLIDRTNDLLGKSGIVGEQTNRQLLYQVYGSRKQRNTLHVICLSGSGTGKTYLQEKVSNLIPQTEKYNLTSATENALYYMDKNALKNKLVVVEDLDGMVSTTAGGGVLYHLRELQSKQHIIKSVPLKDMQTGQIKTTELELYGPITLTATTTKEHIYEDNANRCLLIYLDNSQGQTEAIMNYQRKQSAGTIDEVEEQRAVNLLRNVQRVLQPVKVINPYAEELRIPEECFKPLRTHSHYLAFIETITYYHQYQREEKANEETGEVYIESTIEDIKIANRLLKEVLLAKSDPLSKASRDFFEGLKIHLKTTNTNTFYGKELIKSLKLYPMKVSRNLRYLESFGVIKKVGGNKKTGYEYEVSEWRDYEELKEGVTVLDSLLAGLEK